MCTNLFVYIWDYLLLASSVHEMRGRLVNSDWLTYRTLVGGRDVVFHSGAVVMWTGGIVDNYIELLIAAPNSITRTTSPSNAE